MKHICRTITIAILIAIASFVSSAGTTSKYSGIIDKISNPDMKTDAEIKRVVGTAKALKTLLSDGLAFDLGSKKYTETIGAIGVLDEFVRQMESSDRIEFATARDPGIIAIRDNLKIPAPKGFAYVLTGVPPTDEDLAGKLDGVTYNTRCIKIVSPMVIYSHGLTDSPDREILSHELIHTYLRASIGKKGGVWPKWFTEGLALYYSGAKIQEVKIKQYELGSSLVNSSLSTDYANYLRVFIYLSKIEGKAKFEEFLRKSILLGSVEKPMEEFIGNKDFKELITETSYWELQRIVFILIVAVWFFYTVGTLWGIITFRGRRHNCEAFAANYQQQIQAALLRLETGNFVRPHLDSRYEKNVHDGTIFPIYLKRITVEIILGIALYFWYMANHFIII
jgi:hypothetical protein